VNALDRQALLRDLSRREARWTALDEAPLLKRLLREPVKDNRLRLHRWRRRLRGQGYGAQIRARLFTGQRLNVVVPELVGNTLYRFGFWERDLTQVLLSGLWPGMVFVDVGAHYGYFSLLASRLVGRDGMVFAFEPIQSTFDVLRRNLGREANVNLERIAAYNTRGTFRMLDFGPNFSAFNTLRQEANLPEWLRPYYAGELHPVEDEVETMPLDEYFAGRSVMPDLIKIDAEAVDYQVLQGMRGILTRSAPAVVIEAGDFDIEGAVPATESVSFMTELGYTCLEFEAGNLVPHHDRAVHEFGALYFVKR
jgi:FkbM family methyltransferase